MSSTDPLTQRHGAFISQTWSVIAEARKIALANPSKGQSATQLRRIRFLRSKVLALHRTEMHRAEASTPAIDGWFQPVEDTLARAEAYFSDRLSGSCVQDVIAYRTNGKQITAAVHS